MKTLCLLVSSFLLLAGAPRLSAQCHTFTQEHVDLLAVQWDAASNQWSLMASDDDHNTLYASNQCVVLCPESAKFTLPAGTPLGNAGDPLWILPQNPYPGVPYVGISAEALAPGSFEDPLTIRLLRVDGPGHFLVWQATGFGSFDLKLDTRDGIDANDQLTPFVGGHEPYGALTYTRAKAASDCRYDVVATSDLFAPEWQLLTIVHQVVDLGPQEQVTVRDDLPLPTHAQRFYRLEVSILP